MPRAKKPVSTANLDPEQLTFEMVQPFKEPTPDVTSYITRNAALIQARTTNSQLQTEGTTTDLKKEDNKDLLAILGPDYSDQFKSPYNTVDLIRFHEVIRDDGIAAAAIEFLVQFILGDHFKTIIDINAEFDTEEEENAARDFFANSPQIKGYKKQLDRVNREVKLQTKMMALLIQMLVFGRACGLKEVSDIDNLPIAIKVLPSMTLGQVYVHRKTWDVLGVEYLDYEFPKSILKAEDIIYFPNRDYNISPGTFHYGYSLLERIVDLSELNRITNQRNLKEINFRLWAAFLLIKIPGSFNKTAMKKLVDEIANGAGNSIVTNMATDVQVHQLGHDMEKLLDQRDKNYREEIRQLQVPIILFDPDILNRATSQELMEAWTISVLKVYRSWFKDIVQDQWINPILETLIENERSQSREEEQTVSPLPESTDTGSETANTTLSIKKEVVPIEAIDPATGEVLVYRLPWKIKIELDPPNYDTAKERAEMAILLKNNGLATLARALKMTGVTDENELAQLLQMEEERRMQREQIVGAQVAQTQQQQVQPDQQTPNRQRTVENQRQSMRNQLTKSVRGQNIPSQGVKRNPQ